MVKLLIKQLNTWGKTSFESYLKIVPGASACPAATLPQARGAGKLASGDAQTLIGRPTKKTSVLIDCVQPGYSSVSLVKTSELRDIVEVRGGHEPGHFSGKWAAGMSYAGSRLWLQAEESGAGARVTGDTGPAAM
jgi:hypothetical protein